MKIDIKKLKIPFTQTPNKLINSKRLSFKAKGIFTYLQSKPKGWKFSVERIAKDFPDGIDSVQSGLHELEEFGYLVRIRKSDGNMIYQLFIPVKEKPIMGKTTNGKTQNGKIQEYNNKDINNNKEEIYSILKENKKTISSMFDEGKIPVSDPAIFDWRWAMKDANSRANLFFIGLFWKKKGFTFDNKEEAGEELVRLLRTSNKYASKFLINKFADMLEWIELDSNNKGNYEWGFDTLNKRLSIYNQEK